MPIYESESTTREDLFELRKKNLCQVCGGPLDVFLDSDSHRAFLACRDWPRTHHEGLMRGAPPPFKPNIETGRKEMEVKQDEVTQEQWEEMKKIAQGNVCSECGAELQVHTDAEKGTIEVGCLNREHHGWVQRETWTQAFRRGEPVHPAIQSAIECKMMPKDELGRAMNLLALRYPQAIVDAPTAALFIMDCARLDLDPLISPAEAVPVPFKSRKKDKKGSVIEKTTIQMVITEDGWLSMAARGCPERWAGAPAVEPVYDPDLAESLCKDREAWLWKATGRTRDMEPGQTSSAYGYYTHIEWNKIKDTRVPAASQPGNQARVRAIKHWVRENFAECRQKMMDLTAEWYHRAEGIKAAQEYIDAEYSLIAEGGGKIGAPGAEQGGEEAPVSPPQEAESEKIAGAPPAELEGEGFRIDLTWLGESLNALKWTNETAKTFLASQYKVSPQGTLEDVIKRLTREQAEDFVKEINKRLEKQQPSLFE